MYSGAAASASDPSESFEGRTKKKKKKGLDIAGTN